MRQAFGPYTLARPIAVGGIGEVFVAEHEAGTCAIKRLHRELAERPEQLALFRAEAALARQLSHSNVVKVIDSGEVDGEHFIAMELVRGPNLVERRESGPVSRSQALRVAIDVCAALDHIHDSGFVHCDVSPSNILLNQEGSAKLTDLGVASQLGTRQPDVRGTFAYMSPEQAKGETLSRSSDVFAVGVVLWELLMNARLFRRGAQYLTIAAVVEDPAPSIGDDALAPVLARALRKRAAERYSSCAELANALNAGS